MTKTAWTSLGFKFPLLTPQMCHFLGTTNWRKSPLWRVQFTLTPSNCLLYTFMHPCPTNNLVLKNYFFPERERAVLVPPTMKHFPSQSGWQCNSETSGAPLVLMKTHPTAMAGGWPPVTHEETSLNTLRCMCCTYPACAKHRQLPSALPTAILTLQSTSPWVMFQECPACR